MTLTNSGEVMITRKMIEQILNSEDIDSKIFPSNIISSKCNE